MKACSPCISTNFPTERFPIFFVISFTEKTYSTIAVAIGGVSSLARLGGQHVGVLKTSDGGDSWQVVGTQDLYGYRLQGVAIAGDSTPRAIRRTSRLDQWN